MGWGWKDTALMGGTGGLYNPGTKAAYKKGREMLGGGGDRFTTAEGGKKWSTPYDVQSRHFSYGRATNEHRGRRHRYEQGRDAPTIDRQGFDSAMRLGEGARGLNMQSREQAQQTRAQMQQNLNSLRMQAAGVGTSQAELMRRQGQEDAVRAAMSMAGSARGGNAAAAYRQAAQQNAQTQQQGVRDASMLRAQEMGAARDAYTAAIGQQAQLDMSQQGADQAMRSLDQQRAAAQASLAEAQAGLQMAQQQQDDAMVRFYEEQLTHIYDQQSRLNMAYAGLQSENYNAAMDRAYGASKDRSDRSERQQQRYWDLVTTVAGGSLRASGA